MVEASPNHAGADRGANLTDKQRRILDYLRKHTDDRAYFKSRCIADELGLTPKEVGTNIPAIQQATTTLEIEKWGYSSSTTWLVSA